MNSAKIAELAGVSRATVSRVINNSGYVKEETRIRIKSLMQEHNYVPSESARRLAGAKVSCVGLFIIDIGNPKSTRHISHSDYFSHVTTHVIDQANYFNKEVLVTLISVEEDLNKLYTLHKNNSIGSSIIIGAKHSDIQIAALKSLTYPSIVVDLPAELFSQNNYICCINFDNVSGSKLATKLLIDKGYKHIAHFAGDMLKLSGTDREKGYRLAMEEASLLPAKADIIVGHFSEQVAFNKSLSLLKSSTIDAIFSSNDMMALGIIKACHELNIRVPEDLAIIGFDNSPICNYCQPSLSSVNLPYDELANASINALEYYNEHNKFKKPFPVLSTELVLRNSH